MEMMGVRQFRDAFPTLTHPVRVIRSISRDGSGPVVLGVWTPEKRAESKAVRDG
jgi:hypothetical protein